MSSYLIQPYEQIIKYSIVRIDIIISNLELNTKAGITTNFFDDTGTLRRQEFAILEGEEYMDWTTDDYVVNWVCNKYGLQLLGN